MCFNIQTSDGCISKNRDDQNETEEGALELAIRLLPFYLSNADYMPELAARAYSMRTYKIVVKHGALDSEIKSLHQSIDLYLTVSLGFLYSRPGQTSTGYTEDTLHTECIPGAIRHICTGKQIDQFGECSDSSNRMLN